MNTAITVIPVTSPPPMEFHISSTIDLIEVISNKSLTYSDKVSLVDYLKITQKHKLLPHSTSICTPEMKQKRPQLTQNPENASSPNNTLHNKPSISSLSPLPPLPFSAKHSRYHSMSSEYLLNFTIDHPVLGCNLFSAAIYFNHKPFITYLISILPPQQIHDLLLIRDSNDKLTYDYIFYLNPIDQFYFAQLFDQFFTNTYLTSFSPHPIFHALKPPKNLVITEHRQIINFYLRQQNFNVFMAHPETKCTLLHSILTHFCPLTDFLHLCTGSKRRNSNPMILMVQDLETGPVSTPQEREQNWLVECTVFQFLDEILELSCEVLFSEQLLRYPDDPLNNSLSSSKLGRRRRAGKDDQD
jgi:hypothetical protein